MLALKANQTLATESFTLGPTLTYGYADSSLKGFIGPSYEISSYDETRYPISNVSSRDANGFLLLKPQAFSRNRTKIGPMTWMASGVCDRGPYNANKSTKREVFYPTVNFCCPVNQDLVRETTLAAQSNFLDDVANANANLPVIWAERRATYSMVAGRLVSIWEGIRNAKIQAIALLKRAALGSARVNFRGRWVTPIAKYWLEFWFGWFPSIMDLYTLCKHIDKETVTVSHGRSTRSFNKTYSQNDWSCESYQTVRCHARAKIVIVDQKVKSAAELGILNPALVAWELITLSWLIDYFINFGAYLAQLTALAGVRVEEYSMTTDVNVMGSVTAVGKVSWGAGGGVFTDVPRSTIRPGYVIHRSKTRSLQMPGIPVIRLNTDLSLKQSANALALAIAKTRLI